LDYNFIGTITHKRKWVKKYTNNSIIAESSYGRNIHKKYEIDKDYYNTISKSKFTLTPTGDCFGHIVYLKQLCVCLFQY
jgi:hypothetical protein